MPGYSGVKRRWRFYATATGRKPVRVFLDELPDTDAAGVAAAMREVAVFGLEAARHIRGDVYELRVDGDRQAYRLLFATQGRRSQVLLALEAFSKKTQKTPLAKVDLAAKRLADWRARGSRQ